jgi:regulator of RNase E activity RraA
MADTSAYERRRLREPLPPGLLAALDGASASEVSDVLGMLGHDDGHMDGLAPLAPGTRLLGRAVTVAYAPVAPGGTEEQAPYSPGDAIGHCEPGDVMVLAAGDAPYSFWGAHMARFAVHTGVAGVIVDGRVRDADELREMPLPVFSRGPTPKSSRGRHVAVGYNEPVECAGARVRPGDLVLADADGVVVVPSALFAAVEHGIAALGRFETWVLGARARGVTSAEIGAEHARTAEAIRAGAP